MSEYRPYKSFLIQSAGFLLACLLFSSEASEIKINSFSLASQSQVYTAYELAAENQTSFFRDSDSLFVLFEETLDRVLEMKNERFRQTSLKEPVLIHSAGASDFKEAYSVIMTLYEHYDQYPEKWGGYTPKDIFVQASDISVYAVNSGIQGAYSDIEIFILGNQLMAERGWSEKKTENFITRFFNKVPQKNAAFYVIKPEYKKHLIPRVGNLMDSDLHPPKADIVLYNNVWRPVYHKLLGVEFLGSMGQFLHSFQRNNGGFLISNAFSSSFPSKLRHLKSIDSYYVLSYEDTPCGIMDEEFSMTKYNGEFI